MSEVVGFDFGTTNSLVSVIESGRCISYFDETDMPVPSVVCYEGLRTIAGRDAKNRLSSAGLGVHGNIVRSPKTLLGRHEVSVDGVMRSPIDIVREVVAFTAQQASRGRGRKARHVERAVVTIPVTMEGRRRAALRDAFYRAGIHITQFVHEPLAALYGYLRGHDDYEAALRRHAGQLLLVVDWGGGTLDITLCRIVDGMLVQLGTDGLDDVGGDHFDETLRNEVERRFRASKGIAESSIAGEDSMSRLMQSCESAKIALSGRETARIFVPSFYSGVAKGDLDYALKRDELEAIVMSLLDRGFERIQRLLDKTRYSTAAIGLCLAAGGMVAMPAIRTRLHQMFGAQRVKVPDTAGTLISQGAAWVAHDGARLHLAKSVELLLARNASMVVLPAGTEMPQESEMRRLKYSLFCADPRDGFAKFQLRAPLQPGKRVLADDERAVLTTFGVEVDCAAKPFRESIELELAVDHNLVLHARAFSTNHKGEAHEEVHQLEFGLSLPGDAADHAVVPELPGRGWNARSPHDPGDVVLRANVTSKPDRDAIPGELLGVIDPAALDTRAHAPQAQRDEALYYQPCAVCGSAANDPQCRCDERRMPTVSTSPVGFRAQRRPTTVTSESEIDRVVRETKRMYEQLQRTTRTRAVERALKLFHHLLNVRASASNLPAWREVHAQFSRILGRP